MFKTKNKSGFSLVEILLAITIFAIFTIGITYLSLDTLDRDAKVVLNNEALMYAQEALEATRNIRDKNYLALTNGDHGLDFADNSWSFDLAPELVDDFYDRTVTVSDVYRNEAGNIDSEGTVFDPDTKKIDVRVNWLQNGVIPREVTLTEYLSNWKGDDWIQTTCSDFGEELGEEPLEPTTPSITVCTMLLDDQGNIITGEDLAGTEFRISLEDEDNQEVSESVFQTPFVYTRRVIATSPNYDAYCITYDNLDEENYSYSQEVITNNESYFETPLYNDQFDVQIQSLSDFYQYNTPGNENANGSIDLGLAEKNRTLVVLNRYNTEIGDENPIRARGVYNDTEKTDIDSPPDDNCGIKLADVEQASSFQTSADVGKHCTAVDVDGNYAYVSVNDTSSGFQVINITNKDNPTIVGSKNVGGKGRSVLKDGNYAYVGVEKSNGGMAIVNVSNPSSLVTTSTINLGDYGNGAAVNNNYLYAAIDQVTNALKIYNVSNKSAPSLTKTLNLSDSIHAIITNGNYAYVGSYADHTGLRVLNISTPATTSQVASLNVNEEVNAIAIDGNIAYLGIQSSSNSLKIVNISNPISP
ncbi:MAG: prepilin-type N-terminal cleavage/methylation domain-containing protein, partial [Candidatus Gracilibacteria bacterium]